MNSPFWIIIIIIILFSFISAAFVLRWFFKKKKPIKRETVEESIRDVIEPDYALKRWRFFAFFWPLLCVVFAGIIIYQSIVYQSVHGMEERIFDAAFTIIPLVMFAIGMSMYRRLLKERRYAVILTTATVVSTGRSLYAGKRHFFPEYEFQVGEKIYKVKSPSGYSVCYVKEGRQVDLYYAPENPKVFYVPIMQKHDKRWATLLCGIGILYPIIGLFAPWLRMLMSFIE